MAKVANIVLRRNEVSDGNHCQSTCVGYVYVCKLHVFCRRWLVDPITVCGRGPVVTVML